MGQLTKGQKSKITNQASGNIGKYRPNYKLQISKKLNPFSYLIIGSLYTLSVVLTTLNLAKDERSPRGFSYSEEKIKGEVMQEVRHFRATNNKIRVDNQMTNQMERFRDELMAEVNRVNIKYIEMIENNESLKKKEISALADREPASVKIQKGKPIIFNKANSKLLRFVQNKEYKRARQNYRYKREELSKHLDLTNNVDIEKLRDYDDLTEINLYEMKQRHRSQREEFQKKRYIVVKN